MNNSEYTNRFPMANCSVSTCIDDDDGIESADGAALQRLQCDYDWNYKVFFS